MKKFYKEVPRERGAMEEFLHDHERYWTMNSWNRMHSYANCIRLHMLELPDDIKEKAHGVIKQDEFFDIHIAPLIENFEHEYQGYRVFSNGRSAEYIVLGQKKTNSGIDEGRDFDDLDYDDLKNRVELVQAFDKLCDDCVATLIDVCRTCDIVEDIIMVEKKITRLVEKEVVCSK